MAVLDRETRTTLEREYKSFECLLGIFRLINLNVRGVFVLEIDVAHVLER